MKALVFKDHTLSLKTMNNPKSGPDEALIRIQYAGICQTDIEITKGYMQFSGIPGHEFVGTVVECKNSAWIDKRVVGEINIGCGQCASCFQEDARHCTSRSVLGIQNKDGCFAEYITMPTKNLIDVSNSIDGKEAVFTEPIAAACEILEQVHIQPHESVAIVGDGRLAQLISRVLKLHGCKIVMIGKHDNKLKLAEDEGVDTFLLTEIAERKFDVVIEASGSASGMALAIKLTKPRGVLVLKSTYEKETPLPLAQVVIDEISIVGSRCGRFEPAVRLLKHQLIRVDDLISGIFPLTEYEKAFEVAKEQNGIKVLFSFNL